MSKRSRQANDFAPSTFPFLAVLLCAIGALVLILVITVVHSQASARNSVESELSDAIEHAEEDSDYLVSISQELMARREKVQKEIESRRKELSHVEDHITRLGEELKHLQERSKLFSKEQERSQTTVKAQRIEELRKEIETKKTELAEELAKKKDQSPAFSIIPYDGPNGTSRRPVYIECRETGVVIQPEGIAISIEDLGPPHGPGNPLDAALRVLRNAYQARDANYGITIPPYPLLIVRPDGIHSYALARAAMSGWDDQFGYELIDADMQIAYPDGVPRVAEELNQVIAAAQQRRRGLIAALPARYSRNPYLGPESDGDSWGDDASPPGSSSTGNHSLANTKQSKSGGGGGNSSNWNDASDSDGGIDESGRWKMVRTLPPGSIGPAASMGKTVPNGVAAAVPSPYETPHPDLEPNNYGESIDPLGSDESSEYEQLATGSEAGMNSRGRGAGAAGGGDGGTGQSSQGSMAGNIDSQSRSSANRFSSGSATGSSMGASQLGSQPEDAAMQMALQEQAMKNSYADKQANPLDRGNENYPAGEGQKSDQQNTKNKSRETRDLNTKNKSQAGLSGTGSANSRSTSTGRSSGPDQDLKPISVTAGRDWATTRMDSKSTPVSRPIRIIALDDRWLVRREGQEWKYDAEIQLQDGPQVAGEKLEQAIRERVDSWGLSLPGGYWVPSLTVEAATDADTSVQRLKRLLDGSGVIIKVEPLQTHSSSANTSPNQLPSQQLPIQQATNQKLDSRPSIAPQRQAITPEFPKRK